MREGVLGVQEIYEKDDMKQKGCICNGFRVEGCVGNFNGQEVGVLEKLWLGK